MARFAMATLGGTLVSAGTRNQMWTPVRLADGSATSFGLGWQIQASGGRQLVLATGQQEEVSTLLLLIPDRQAAVVLMSNLERSVQQLLVPILRGVRAATGLN